MTETAITDTSHNSRQISTKFVPSENQRKWTMTALEMRSSSPTEIADKMGMDRSTFYLWLDDPAFKAWWNATWDKYYEQVKHRIIEAGVKNAEKDHTWWRDMMEFLGLIQPINSAPPVQNQVNIMANAFSDSAKQRGVDVTGTVPDDSKE